MTCWTMEDDLHPFMPDETIGESLLLLLVGVALTFAVVHEFKR